MPFYIYTYIHAYSHGSLLRDRSEGGGDRAPLVETVPFCRHKLYKRSACCSPPNTVSVLCLTTSEKKSYMRYSWANVPPRVLFLQVSYFFSAIIVAFRFDNDVKKGEGDAFVA